jgi:glutamate synthase (NADPH/NADH) small chain
LTGGAEQSRDLPVPGRDLMACTLPAVLPSQNKVNGRDKVKASPR